MKLIIQRVKNVKILIDNKQSSSFDGDGLLVYFAAKKGDKKESADWLADKIVNLRIFEDANGKMNKSVKDIGGNIAIVSEFTLYGSCRKGKRPSFDECEFPENAEKLFNYFVSAVKNKYPQIITGKFRSFMEITSTNIGPATFVLEHCKTNK